MNCIVVYTSMTGNTEEIAMRISQGLYESNIHVVVKDSFLINPEELLNYDGIIMGSYTWNDGDLPDELVDFYDEMGTLDFTGKKTATFGSGDTTYTDFCKAVDILKDRFQELGAVNILPGLKIENSPFEGEIDRCREFGKKFADALVN